MSNIFNYEIDERNLRVQLKNLEFSVKEDAWEKFEAYASENPVAIQRSGWKPVQISLSRNLVLPLVFGLIVFLFSFLLYNFVDIKDQAPATEVSETPAVKPPAETPVRMTEKPAQPVVAANKVLAAPAVQPSKKEAVEVPVQKVATQEPEKIQEPAAQQVLEPQQAQVQPKKQRRRRGDEYSDIRPTVVAEEEAPVEIPQ